MGYENNDGIAIERLLAENELLRKKCREIKELKEKLISDNK